MIQASSSCTALLRNQTPRIPQILCRHKSITAAIERGKQNSGEASTFRTRRQEKDDEFQGRAYNLRKRKDTLRDLPSSRLRYRPSSVGEWAERRVASGSVETLRYTTAASEFLYGYSSVLAAIKANRRKLYKLYVNERGINHTNGRALMARARHAGVDVREVGPHYIAAMEKASSGRPNNGFILEASPLPVPPIAELQYVQKSYNTLSLVLDQQSKEDAEVNGTRTEYPFKSAGWRNPLILYVDGVLDEGNLGAIARSAYFLGVDALITPTRQSAPWSHIAVKASAGAAEALPIFKVNQPTDFLGRSARAGWRIYASDAIPATEQRAAPFDDSISAKNTPSNFASSVVYTFARSVRRLPANHSPLESHPTILMMGAEGTGLRTSLLNMAHYKVGIRHGRDVDEVGVDSLNVSVATSLLCYHMLQKPIPTRSPGDYLF